MMKTPLYILKLCPQKLLLSTLDIFQGSLNDDLERIASWGADHFVNLDDKKKQFQLMTLLIIENDPFIIFQDTIIRPTKTFHIIGLTVS